MNINRFAIYPSFFVPFVQSLRSSIIPLYRSLHSSFSPLLLSLDIPISILICFFCRGKMIFFLTILGGVQMVVSFVSSFSSFGVCGSRVAGSPAVRLASVVVPAVAGLGAVSCGCASGVDSVARPFASSVFPVSSFGSGRAAFALRSVAFVQSLASSPHPVLFVFPSGACPPALFPSSSSRACFCGLGSGSWASAAFAAGLGIPVVVFGLPASSLPSWSLFSSWQPVSAFGVSGFVFVS